MGTLQKLLINEDILRVSNLRKLINPLEKFKLFLISLVIVTIKNIVIFCDFHILNFLLWKFWIFLSSKWFYFRSFQLFGFNFRRGILIMTFYSKFFFFLINFTLLYYLKNKTDPLPRLFILMAPGKSFDLGLWTIARFYWNINSNCFKNFNVLTFSIHCGCNSLK